jgi:chemotaxis protein methyltransferase CheR
MALSVTDIEDIEIPLLLEGIHRRYGFDFRDYASSSIRRRILARVEAEGVPNISALQARVLHDPGAMERLLVTLTVHVTAMFRDPGFYIALRDQVLPVLDTYPFIRIWHAGCSTGEEAYSMAILLHEEGLYDRSRIYATDLSEPALRLAKAGVYRLDAMRTYTQNYIEARGRAAFSDYYTADNESAILRPHLQKNLVFAQHNLTTDAAFNEFHIVMCRNVMIYFNTELQHRVCTLLHQSLLRLGILALGRRESLRFTPHERSYQELDPKERLYRRME